MSYRGFDHHHEPPGRPDDDGPLDERIRVVHRHGIDWTTCGPGGRCGECDACDAEADARMEQARDFASEDFI